MSIITDIKEFQQLELARSRPSLVFLPFAVSERLAKIHRDLFDDVSHTVHVHFITKGSLACIYHTSECASIYIHQLLNNSETPVEVIDLILKHELLHLRIPPALEDGKMVYHPTAFWEAEKAIAPEHDSAWEWVWSNLRYCLKPNKKLERIDVSAKWKDVWNQPKLDLAKCLQMAKVRPKQAEESDRW